jgi:serine/threonine protein phosphatase 1
MAGPVVGGTWDPTRAPRLPDGVRIYAVGDIHGCADLLDAVLTRIERDLRVRPPRREALAVFVGDYVDRGPDSHGVVERLLAGRPARARPVHLKGNHEDMLLRFLADPAGQGDVWLANGGMATLRSYGVTPPGAGAAALGRGAADLARAMPGPHLEFYSGLGLTFECGDYLFVHAGLRPGTAIGAQSADDLLWIRGAFMRHDGAFAKYVVHGHTPRSEPEVLWNRADIDTGAFASGRLTCLVLEGETRRVFTTDGLERAY